MTTRNQKVAVGVFADATRAQQAVSDLRQAGFGEDQIGVVSQNAETAKTVKGKGKTKKSNATKAEEGALAGVAAGAGVGALWALGIAAGLLPGIGPAIAGGILASVLASAAGGAAVAGLVGALVGLGIPEEDAKYYESEFKAGRTIVTVKADARYEEAMTILQRHGAYNRQTLATQTAPAKTGAVSEATGKVELHEEQLRATKKPVKKGEVKVRKEVVTEQKTIDVPVEREEVVISHRATGRRKGSASDIAAEEIRIPVKEEEVHVEKETVTTGEVTVGKRKVRGTRQVSGTVRKEKLRVEDEGNSSVRRDV